MVKKKLLRNRELTDLFNSGVDSAKYPLRSGDEFIERLKKSLGYLEAKIPIGEDKERIMLISLLVYAFGSIAPRILEFDSEWLKLTQKLLYQKLGIEEVILWPHSLSSMTLKEGF